jgi:hypothetical protein
METVPAFLVMCLSTVRSKYQVPRAWHIAATVPNYLLCYEFITIISAYRSVDLQRRTTW